MKKILIILLFCITSVFAQEKKYQSLLWEVSGNGLTKKSYLYGSMHVSDKVSYHLSDAFFTHLLNADIVANESEPSTWTDLFGMFNTDYSQYRKFYSKFYQIPLSKEQLYPLFQTNNFTLNNLLFRTNEYQKEYQEDTYLDMFIYRAGKKFNKKTVGLEDTKTSILGIMNADLSNNRPKEQNMAAIQKILKNNGYEEALMNFYRDKDLDMIDSLTSLSTSENYLKALLYDRNIVMVKSIDSLAKQGSLFAAVGAAHLPGQKGIIEMLRRKGYTVTPIFDTYTNKGKTKKQEIEELFIKPVYKNRSTPDGVIELPLFTLVIENGEDLESPDLANGGYINVKRVLLRDYLKKDNKPFDHRSLDSLFYENIPGKIVSKNFYTKDGYSIYDIKNITKTGNTQRYRYYISPLEIIGVSMAGEGAYVSRYENDIFNNIKVKAISSNWKTISPSRGGFSVELPEYTVMYGDRTKTAYVPDIEMYSYDNMDQSHYFVIERTLQTNDILENSLFELKRIHFEFYKQLDIDSTQTATGSNPLSFTSSSKIGNKVIRLKTMLKGSKYYLLGSVGASDNNTDRFFNSFSITPFEATADFRTFTDTVASFSISIPKAANERLDFENRKERYFYDEDEKANEFEERYDSYLFSAPSGQTINLSVYQNHRYEPVKPVDTLWRNFRHMVTGYDTEKNNEKSVRRNYRKNHFKTSYSSGNGLPASKWNEYMKQHHNTIKIINEKVSYNKAGNYHQIELMAVDEQSEQGIKYKGIYKDRRSYSMSTIVDKDYRGDDPVIEKVFASMLPLSTPAEGEAREDKLKMFMEDASSPYDSIRSSALASVNELRINTENIQELMAFIDSYDFKPEETFGMVSLYKKTGYTESPTVLPFLEKQYKKRSDNTLIQFAILNALTSQRSKAGYKKIMELLEHDLPLAEGDYLVNSLFSSFEEDLENSEVLFPDILQFYSIPEYHQPIISFTGALLNNKNISAGKLKSYRKMIITNAKLELKRIKSRYATTTSKENIYYSSDSDTQNLRGYINLLYPFSNEKAVKELFNNIKDLHIDEIDLEFARLDIESDNLTEPELTRLLENPSTLFKVYNLLPEKKRIQYKKITDLDIATSAVMMMYRVKPVKDSISFIKAQNIQHNKKDIIFYFFRITPIKTETYMGRNNVIAAIAFVIENDSDRINPLAYKYLEPVRNSSTEKTDEYIEALIDETINEDKSRASFGKDAMLEEEMYYNSYGGY